MGDIVVAPERGLFTGNRGGRITLWFARDPPYLSLHVKNTISLCEDYSRRELGIERVGDYQREMGGRGIILF
jgi:hypothetical protein